MKKEKESILPKKGVKVFSSFSFGWVVFLFSTKNHMPSPFIK